jgi:hypothetical protein
MNTPSTEMPRKERRRTQSTTAAEELVASYYRELRTVWRADRDAQGQPVPVYSTVGPSRHGGVR